MSFYQINSNPNNYVQKNPGPNLNQTLAFLKSGFLQPNAISPQDTISGGSHLYTTTELLYRYIIRTTLGGSVTDTTPTAAQIVSVLNQTQSVHVNAQQQPSSGNSAATYTPSKTVQVGFYFDWMVTNTDSVNNLTIAGGVGVVASVPISIPASNTVTIRVLVKNPTSGSESVSMMILSNSISVGTGLATGTYYSDYLFWNPTVALWQVGSAQVHLGQNAGLSGQGGSAVAIGNGAGQTSQQSQSVAIGYLAGNNFQGVSTVSVGDQAGFLNQGNQAIAIGRTAGNFSQGIQGVAIGYVAGYTNQGTGAVAIGAFTGQISQQSNAVAIGNGAGNSFQGASSVAIGYQAGYVNQHANTIVISATGTLNSANVGASYIAPLRVEAANASFLMLYNTTSKELTYSSAASVSTKTFVIDHPDDTDKYLVHACLEGPEAGVYYRGKGEVLEDERSVVVKLPSYVRNLATDFTVQITSLHNKNEVYDIGCNIPWKASEVEDNEFVVYGKGKFYWRVEGSRSSIDVEPLKNSVELKGDGPYKWI